ncbi:8096_t:CDS:2, partial [Gigaspora margarita]
RKLLPRVSGQTIGSSESNAVAYCAQNTTNAPNTRTFSDGFIQTKHFASDTVDINASVGTKCTEYDLFVNLVKPDICRFCIRCCKNATSAKYSTGRRNGAGCERIPSKDQGELRKTKRDLANKNIQNIYMEILLEDKKNKRTPNWTKKSEDYRRNK